MGLIELCLLSVLSPQQPDAAGAAPPANVPAEQPAPPAAANDAAGAEDPKRRLLAAEQQGADADPAELVALTSCDDAAVAARAAWLLANSSNPEHPQQLPEVAAQSPHADARAHAMQHLLKTARPAFAKLAVARLADDDRRVRTLAVQLLAKLRNPVAIDALVSFVDDQAATTQPGPATDVQAAVLALSDFGAADQLMRIATSIHDGACEGTGEALTFAYQTLSPKLAPADELTLLISALDHREAMLRRYAITRIAELDDATAIRALEGRLGAEGSELRPLVENALAQLRRDKGDRPDDELERAKANAKVLWARTKTWWSGLEPLHQGLVAGVPALLLVLLVLMRRAARRRAAHEEGLAAAAMVAPSDDYYDEDEDGEYYEEGEYEEGDEYEEEYDDGEYGDEAAQTFDDDEYDTSGWQEEGEDETLLAEGGLDDERFR